MRIYFVGAHSTGKSTLARYVSSQYRLQLIPEIARTVLAEREITINKLRSDIDLVNDFQAEVMMRQIDTEYKMRDNFVSDRGIDTLAYVADHSTLLNSMINNWKVKSYLDWLRDGLIFFVRPQANMLVEDNVRETPTLESVYRLDGMVKLLLELFDIPYISISMSSSQERVNLIKRYIEENNRKHDAQR